MLTINTFEISDELAYLKQGVERCLNVLPRSLNGELNIKYIKDKKDLSVKVNADKAEISFGFTNDLFRGIGLAASAFVNNENAEITETRNADTMGIMYDCSRNSVPKISTIEKILVRSALMGYNTFMLYTEDTYETSAHPAFGHFRGKYTKKDLKHLDDYAYSLGIELIPCIQALAHLERFLRWQSASHLSDTSHVLFVGSDEVDKFIETIISDASSSVRSNRIHLGLDEAHGLGLGNKLNKDGFITPDILMKEHLSKVMEICKKLDLEPMMWGDMIFRLNIEGHGYYHDTIELPKGTGDLVPEGMGFIYWDYYHNNKEFYDHYITQHVKQGINPIFAAGVCSWIGSVPNLVKTYETTKNSVASCKQHGINEYFICVWKDDGGEIMPGADLLGTLMYAEQIRNNEDNQCIHDELKKHSIVMTGGSYDAWMSVGSIDEIQEGLSLQGLEPPNPHKYFLSQDILLGQYDKESQLGDFKAVYKQKADYLACYLEENELFDKDSYYGLNYAYNLCRLLEVKVQLGADLKKAYDNKDKKSLSELKNLIAGEYKNRITNLYNSERAAWSHFYKMFGFDIIDMRFGTWLKRAETAVWNIERYLSGETDKIDELEPKRLSFSGYDTNDVYLPHSNNFLNIYTVNQY